MADLQTFFLPVLDMYVLCKFVFDIWYLPSDPAVDPPRLCNVSELLVAQNIVFVDEHMCFNSVERIGLNGAFILHAPMYCYAIL